MNRRMIPLCAAWLLVLALRAQVPESLVVDGIPPIPNEVKASASRYLEFRSGVFQSWHPARRELLITTRFADAAQVHWVRQPGGDRHQITFRSEPVAAASFQPVQGEYIVFTQDQGGGEFFQLYRQDLRDGKVTLLTDGKSRNSSPRWARSGRQLAYSSTRRNGRDTDLYAIDPADPKSDRQVITLTGGGWSATDWSPDEKQLVVLEYVSIEESRLHLVDVAAGTLRRLTPAGAGKVAYGRALFSRDGRSIFTSSDRDSEFRRLVRIDVATGKETPIGPAIAWDVEDLELSSDGRTLAYITNDDGASVLHLLDTTTLRPKPVPALPRGVISGLEWHSTGREIAFTLSSARSPGDTWSLDVASRKLTRWTESETGGLDPRVFPEPELVRFPSFDGRSISAWVYRPDPARFPGRRPVLMSIHGGPESQARPTFQARNNYFVNELGLVLVVPNVRGSSGYGKTFLALDNGRLREDSVKDIGAVLDWIGRDPGLDAGRVAVMGGSYGGYMTLATLVHYSDRLRAGVDIVGISHFVTFLENTQDYRRDLRRVEYGDERDPAMREFLKDISPLTHVDRLRRPLFVVQGQNDPRVPATESAQMVKALRDRGGTAWYLLAKDEGHGFAKKRNQDFQFLATVLFLDQQVLR